MFRQRTEHDCSCCRNFVRRIGGIVAIRDGQIVSLWDVQAGDPAFQAVADALAAHVRAAPIENIFLETEASIGTDRSHEQLTDRVQIWDHFHLQLPRERVVGGVQLGAKLSDARASHDVLLRALREITVDAIETVSDLIAQNGLYRGAEKQALVGAFKQLKAEYDLLRTNDARDLFVWGCVQGSRAWACRVRSDVIGTLLCDLSEGVPLESAVQSFENKVSGTNYKRPTALITPKMRDAARTTLDELGLLGALERRFAVSEDVRATDVLFADRSTRVKLGGDVFDDLPVRGQNAQSLGGVQEMGIEDFLRNVLPTAQRLEVLLENRHGGNLVSLTAPGDMTAPTLFKWDNAFAWSYAGDVADSIRERVKKAGGNVEGDVCCRLAWHNTDDLDFHMEEPGGGHICYSARRSACGGVLDVDANGMDGIRPDPCENIVYASTQTMRHGTYKLYVHQFAQRQSVNVGFEAEIDILGTVHSFSYPKALRTGDRVQGAELHVGPEGVKVVPQLESSQAVREVWGLKTQTFHPVSLLTLSPNHWGEQGVGNKHYFFILSGAKNDGTARGFYNEFLKGELEAHRKAMELVGSRMRTEASDRQLSGLGFSSTQRNSVTVRVTGSFTRMVKITF